jgi:hypothetical protein
VKDLHSKIKLPTIWVALHEGKFLATSHHDHVVVDTRTYFVLENHAATAAVAIDKFVSSQV